MNTDSELIVISAAGSPRTTVIRPVMTIAIIAAIASFAIENGVEPYARERLRTIVSEARADLIGSIVDEGTFQTIDDGLVIQIGERLPDGRFGGIFLVDTREENTELIYYADQGAAIEINGEHILVMQDGVVHRRAPDGDISVIRYRSYAIDLAEFAPASDGPNFLPKDRTLAYLFNPDPNDPYFQESPDSMRAELHRRLTDWFYPIVFALVGLAVAGDARSFRESRIHPMLTTMLVALFVRWGGFVAANEASEARIFLYGMYVVPLAASAVCVYMIASSRSLELPAKWHDRLQSLWTLVSDRAAGFSLRSAARSSGPEGGRR
jgi:lipopolysaccharide export system permease protein